MPASELNTWAKYFEARPIGWREDNRTAMLLNAQGVKESAVNIFPTLNQLKRWDAQSADEDIMRRSLNKSIFGAMLEGAQPKKD